MITGVVMLLVNLSFPLVYRQMLENPYSEWNNVSVLNWYGFLPLAVGSILLLPKGAFRLTPANECNWLPDFYVVCWTIGTGVHLGCIDWIDKHDFACFKIAPVVWVLAWPGR
jgi:hypothetical protein